MLFCWNAYFTEFNLCLWVSEKTVKQTQTLQKFGPSITNSFMMPHLCFFVMNNIGYLHCSNWIFFLCCSKQRIWFFNDIPKVLKTLQIEIFWKLILWMKIVPLYETNNLNILPYFSRMFTISYDVIETSTEQFSFVLYRGESLYLLTLSIFFLFIEKTTILMIRYNDPPCKS